jgi:hypothetical protein
VDDDDEEMEAPAAAAKHGRAKAKTSALSSSSSAGARAARALTASKRKEVKMSAPKSKPAAKRAPNRVKTSSAVAESDDDDDDDSNEDDDQADEDEICESPTALALATLMSAGANSSKLSPAHRFVNSEAGLVRKVASFLVGWEGRVAARVSAPSGWWGIPPKLTYDGQYLLYIGRSAGDVVALDLTPAGLQRAALENGGKAVEAWRIPTRDGAGSCNMAVSEGTNRISVLRSNNCIDVYDGNQRVVGASGTVATLAPVQVGMRGRHRKNPDLDGGSHVNLSRDGTRVGFANGTTVSVFDVASGALVNRFDLRANPPQDEAEDDGKMEEEEDEDEDEEEDDNDDNQAFDGVIWSFSLSPDGLHVACGGEFHDFAIFDVDSGTMLKSLCSNTDRLHEVVWTGSVLAGGCVIGCHSHFGGSWFSTATFEGAGEAGVGVRLSPYGLVASFQNGALMWQDPITGEVVQPGPEPKGSSCPEPRDSVQWWNCKAAWRAWEGRWITRAVEWEEKGRISVWE